MIVLYIINTRYLYKCKDNNMEIIRAMIDIAYEVILDTNEL